jgi:predicted nucleotidyltransferase
MQTEKYIPTRKEKHFKELEEMEAVIKVMYWFFDFPSREISLNDLSESAGISKTTANKVVLKLVEQGFLNKEVLGRIWRISCNISHPFNLFSKVPYHLQLIYQSGILDAIYKIIPNPKAIILFGSYRKGDDTEQSDIDIAVEVLGNDELKIHELGKLEQIGNRKNIKVNLHIFSRNKIDLNLFANIANGIVLAGFLEVRP